ncbi:hypothetical protein Q0O53_13655, partial [Staphylococcus aureus]|nr:hypothetical protein [Staphylococcus aureus]
VSLVYEKPMSGKLCFSIQALHFFAFKVGKGCASTGFIGCYILRRLLFMNVFAHMRMFTIRLRMLGAIAVVLLLLGMLGGAGMWGMFRIQSMSQDFR